jgi:hypothetical protein
MQGTGGGGNRGLSSGQAGQSTFTLRDYSGMSSSYHASGSYDSVTRDYSLTSVNYRVGLTDRSTSTLLSGSTMTGGNQSGWSEAVVTTIGGVQSNATLTQSINQSSLHTSLQTQVQTGRASASFREKGTYGNGRFAFGSMVYQSTATSTSTTQQKATDSSTLSTTFTNSGATNYSASGTTLSYQRGNASSTDESFNYTRLYQAGCYANGSVALASLVFDQSSTATANSLQTVRTTQNGNQGTSGLNAMSSSSAGSLNTLVTRLFSGAWSSLHEAGTMASSGSFSLGCVQYDGSGLSSYVQTDYQSQNSSQSSTNTATSSTNRTSNSNQANSTLNNSGVYSYTVSEIGRYQNGQWSLSSFVFNEGASSNQNFNLSGEGRSTLNTSGSETMSATDTQTTSLGCSQNASVRIHAAGEYANASYSLSSYSLTGSSSLSCSASVGDNGINSVSGRDASGNNFSSNGTTSLSQATSQSQNGDIVERGTYGGGSFSLSLVSFTTTGMFQITDNRSNGYRFSGASSGTDQTTLTSGGVANYSASGVGSFVHTNYMYGTYAQGFLVLSNYRLQGGSTGSYSLGRSGSAGTTSYSHSDVLNETTTLDESGSVNAVTSESGAPAGWVMTGFQGGTGWAENLSDTVGSTTASASLNDQVTLGVSPSLGGMRTEMASGTITINGRGSSYTAGGSIAAYLPGPGLPQFDPGQALANWKTVGTGLGSIGKILPSLTSPLTGMGLPSAGPALVVPLSSTGLAAPLVPSVIVPGAYGGWLGSPWSSSSVLTANMGLNPWSFLGRDRGTGVR